MTVTEGKVKVGVAVTVGVKVIVGVNVLVGVKVSVGVSVSVGVNVNVGEGVLVHEAATDVSSAAVAVSCDSAESMLQDTRNKMKENNNGKYFFNITLGV